ncbi:lantibiotic dehydratase [Pedobacter frigoris]|nr:lantibiotic dehydratase [Pedobacter frigoris]
MKVTIHPTALFRVPLFPLNATLEQSWEELKTAISLSSTEFYKNIKDIKADQLDTLTTAMQYTIWKYFNRAKYRATPYASFAGVGLCPIGKGDASSQLQIDGQQVLHSFIDWPYKEQIKITIDEIVDKDLKLFANSSYYKFQELIRYITHLDGEFQISELDWDEMLITILEICEHPIPYSTMVTALRDKNYVTEDIATLIEQMVELQLLLSSKHPNLIGEEYFNRINLQSENYPDKYIIAERKLISGHLDESLFKNLDELINLLHNLVPQTENEPLKQFINRLSQKFGEEEIPLMQALDPELGVGFDDLEESDHPDPLINKLIAKKNTGKTAETELKTTLLSALLNGQPNPDQIIQLDQLQSGTQSAKLPLPNTLSALLTIGDEYISVDSLGGNNANTLLGRFTLAGKKYTGLSRELAAIEQQANPEVLFFDIAYIAENNVDNISRRSVVYPMQVSLLNYDTTEQPLTLNDIMISAQRGWLILRSKKHNKRLIPRLATAYNYSRSDLSLFRLLCAMQNQGITANLALDLQAILPDAAFYPRLQFKNFILSPRKWKIVFKDLTNNHATPLIEESLKLQLEKLKVSRYFKAGFADQTLCFDREKSADLSAFLQYLRKQKSTYVEEALLPSSLVQDSQGKPYLGQYLLSLTHKEQIYRQTYVPAPHTDENCIQKNIPPGQDWLYFEIYTHPQRSNQVLTNHIQPLVDEYSALIKKWFFIRYNEYGQHIRLRIQLNDPTNAHYITAALTEGLKQEIQSGVVSEFLIKTYKREITRYGHAGIEAVESHFSKDSDYVTALLATNPSTNQLYQLCITLAQDIDKAGVLTSKDDEFTYVINKVSTYFNEEHQLEAADYKELNIAYKKFKAEPEIILTQAQQFLRQRFTQSFNQTIAGCQPAIKRRQLLGDLIHMHINRLSSTNQRSHEMIMYYFLTKELQREKAKQKNNFFDLPKTPVGVK